MAELYLNVLKTACLRPLENDWKGKDERDGFLFRILNFLFLYGNITSASDLVFKTQLTCYVVINY